MTPRERVQLALSHHRPDRVPRYEIFLPGYAEQWRTHRGADAPADVYDDYPQIDIGTVLAMQDGPLTSRVRREEGDGDTFFVHDSWGRVQKCSRTGTFFEVLQTALEDRSQLDAMIFENPWSDERVAFYRQWEAQRHDRFCPVAVVMGLFMSSYYLR